MFYLILTILTFTFLIIYCCLLVYLRTGLNRLKPGTATHLPGITVIVPAHNEEKNLPRLLDCLSLQNYPSDLTEIILVNDRSIDSTYNIMQNFESCHNNVTVLQINNIIKEITPKKRAIHKAVKSSAGEIILTTDADSSPGPDWIIEMVRAYDKNTGVVLGYAPYRTDKPFNTIFHRILALDYFAMGAIAAASVGIGHPSTCNGANFSYLRKVFEKVRGFGKTAQFLSGDDDLFLHRVRKKSSYKINFAISQKAAVFNNPPKNFKEFVRQRIRFSSKHLAYPAGMIVIFSVVYALYVCLLSLIITSIFIPSFFLILFTALALKTFFEIIFLIPAQRLLEKRNLMSFYPLATIPHILYVVIFPILGQLFRRRW